MEYIYVDELNVGDTLFISGQNMLEIGFFAGKGRGTIQYYTPGGVIYVKKKEQSGVKVKFWKSYVSETSKWRIAKIKTPIFKDKIEEQRYEEAKNYLIQKGIIKI